MTGAAFYKQPLADIAATEKSMTWAARTLPDKQLAAEIAELRQMTSYAANLLRQVYEREAARRANPEHAFDRDLAGALWRLEAQTSAEDRSAVERIGRDIHAIGGVAALDRARDRMLELARPGKRELWVFILEKRWPALIRATETSR